MPAWDEVFPMTSSFHSRILDNSPSPTPLHMTINVVFGLSGNDSGVLAKFEVALTSLLLNASLQSKLAIHIMADSNAYSALGLIFYRTGINGTLWRNSISIQTYDVTPYQANWTNEIISMNLDINTHMIGTYFRLYAHKVLPNILEHVLYMDTDVVIMANLGNLWENIDEDKMFQWGEDKCAGFIVLNLHKLDTLWDMACQCNLAKISVALDHGFNDQLIFLAMNHTFPDVVAVLPDEWAISVANDAWRHTTDIVDYRPKVGMFHFNGGGSNNEAYWESDFLKGSAGTWGVGPYYYLKLPWNWVRFIGESMIDGVTGNPLIIHHN
jgi:hypothetical protein